MKGAKWISLVILTALLNTNIIPTISFADSVEAVYLYVSPNGDEFGTGTENSPVNSISAARKLVRKIKKENKNVPINVILKSGEYRIMETEKFAKEDGGTENAPVTYMAEVGADVTVKSSKKLNLHAFSKVADREMYKRFPEQSRDKIGQISLRNQGISSVYAPPTGNGTWGQAASPAGLYLDGERQILSRWPNEGFSYTGKIVGQYGFECLSDNIKSWKSAEDVRVGGWLSQQYSYDLAEVENIDRENKSITIKKINGSINGENLRYVVFNIPEELDMPGEWYIDRQKMILYYYPPHPLSDETLELSVLDSAMFSLTDCEYINFKGIHFTQGSSVAIEFKNSHHIDIDGCEFSYIGKNALYTPSSDCNYVTIENSYFHDMDAAAIRFGGGDRNTLVPSGNIIRNNHFERLSLYNKTYSPAIHIYGVGFLIEHNLIHGSSSLAINFTGNDHKILYNEIYDVCKEIHDGGAVYAGRSYVWRGSEIAYNYIHDVMAYEETIGKIACGIYMDDRFGAINIHDNVIENCKRGIFMHGSSDVLADNNKVINCELGIQLISTQTNFVNLYDAAEEMIAQYPIYLERYPEMKYLRDNGVHPRGNSFTNNLLYKSPDIAENADVKFTGELRYGNNKGNNISTYENPGFEDEENKNYNLKKDSEILKRLPDINNFDVRDAGLTDKRNSATGTAFKKLYPSNGETEVSGVSALFKWESADYASKYILTVATDPYMKNVIIKKECPFTYTTIEGLKTRNTDYYWDVEAVSMSVNNKNSWKSAGSPYLFTTVRYDSLDKSELLENIEKAEKVYEGLKEGREVGDCVEGTLREYMTLINNAKGYTDLKYGNQKELNESSKALEEYTTNIAKKKIAGYVGVEELIDVNKWISDSGSGITVTENNTLHLDESQNYATKDISESYKVLNFKMKVNYNGGYVAFGVRQNWLGDVWSTSTGNYGYFLAFKEKDIVEYQRFKLNTKGGMLKTVPNDCVIDGQWHEVQVGAIPFDEGNVVIMVIDGKKVLHEIDKSGAITGEGVFQIYCKSGASVEIMVNDNEPPIPISQFDKDYKREDAKPRVVKYALPEGNSPVTMDGNEIYDMKISLPVKNGNTEFMIGYDRETGSGYYLSVKEDFVVVKKKTEGSEKYLGIIRNKYIFDNIPVNIKIGAYGTDNGTRILFYAYGNKIFDYLDDYTDLSGKSFMIKN